MKCAQCQTELPEGKLFCPTCGKYNQPLQESVSKKEYHEAALIGKQTEANHQTDSGFVKLHNKVDQLEIAGTNSKTGLFNTLIIMQVFIIMLFSSSINWWIIPPMVGLSLILRLTLPTLRRVPLVVIVAGVLIISGIVIQPLFVWPTVSWIFEVAGMALLVYTFTDDNNQYLRSSTLGGVLGLILSIAISIFVLIPYMGGKGVQQYNINETYALIGFVILVLIAVTVILLAVKRRNITEILNRRTLFRNYLILTGLIIIGNLFQYMVIRIFFQFFILT